MKLLVQRIGPAEIGRTEVRTGFPNSKTRPHRGGNGFSRVAKPTTPRREQAPVYPEGHPAKGGLGLATLEASPAEAGGASGKSGSVARLGGGHVGSLLCGLFTGALYCLTGTLGLPEIEKAVHLLGLVEGEL